MAEPDDHPVLLTEGSFEQENVGKDSGNQEISSTGEAIEPQQDGGTSGDISDHPPNSPGTVGDDVRPSTAPEPGLSGSLQEVERSVMKAVSDAQNSVPGTSSVQDGEEAGDDFNEAFQQDTLSDRLDQLPCDLGDDVEYMAPIEDPYMRAVHYMEKHKVMQIFQKLTAEIVYHRPPDPLEHMLSELHKMKKDRDAKVEAVISAASSRSPAV